MIEFLQLIYGSIALIGAVAAMAIRNPFDKLIAIGVLSGGVAPFLVDRGYLDVAIAFALIVPVSTIFILMVTRRKGG